MDEESSRQGRGIREHAIILALLALAASGLLAWYWLNRSPLPTDASTTPVASNVTSTILAPTRTEQATALVQRPAIALAIPWEVEGGAAYQTATPPSAAITPQPITLQGPPADSAFRASDEVNFFWLWPSTITAGDQFVLFISDGSETTVVGTVTEMNLGQGYQLQIPLGDIIGQPGNYGWQVVLEASDTGDIVARSELRPIRIIDG